MLSIFRLYNENLSIRYTCICTGCIGCRVGSVSARSRKCGGCGGFGFVLVRNCAWTEKLWLLMTMCRMGYITICPNGKLRKGNIWKISLICYELTGRTRILDTSLEALIDLRMVFQHGTSLVKDKSSDLLVDSHSILTRWKNYLCCYC